MANMSDMARMMAASGGMGMQGEEAPTTEPSPLQDEMAAEASDPIAEIEGAIEAIEAAAPQIQGDTSEKLRQQVEALRSILAEIGSGDGAAPGEAPPAAPPMEGGPMLGGEMAEGELSGA